jgi:hypothetical protein
LETWLAGACCGSCGNLREKYAVFGLSANKSAEKAQERGRAEKKARIAEKVADDSLKLTRD